MSKHSMWYKLKFINTNQTGPKSNFKSLAKIRSQILLFSYFVKYKNLLKKKRSTTALLFYKVRYSA